MRALIAVSAVLLISCTANNTSPQETTTSDSESAMINSDSTVTITGTVTDEGVECPALRTDDNQLYTIATSDRSRLKPGMRVRITGTVAEMSFCQQGTTIGSVNFAEFFVTVAAATTFFLTIGIAAWKPIAGLAIGGAIAAPIAAKLVNRIPARPLMIGVGLSVIVLSVRTILLTVNR